MASERLLEQTPRQRGTVGVERAVDEVLLPGIVLEPAVLDRVAQVLESLEARGVDALEDRPEFPVTGGEGFKPRPFGRSQLDAFSSHETQQAGGGENRLAGVEGPETARYRNPVAFSDHEPLLVD